MGGQHSVLSEGLAERVQRSLQLALGVVAQILAVADRGQHFGVVVTQIGEHQLFITGHVLDRDAVQIAVGAGEDRRGLLFERQRRKLALLQQFGQARAAVQQLLGRGVEVRTELGEGRHFAILGQLQLDRARNLLHRLGLRGRADARHRQADVDGRTDALVEEVGFEEDLAVGDRDHVCRNIGRHVACLGLDDRQRGQRAIAIGVVHLRSAFQQAAVEIEDVARIGFAARRTTQQQRHLTIGDGLLGKVVIHDHGVHAVVAEEFAHGDAGIGRQILERSGLRSGRGDDDRIFHRAIFFELLDDLRDGRALLADGDIDAVELLALVVARVDALLVDEGIDRDGGLAGLAVTDDQFALATADGDEGVDRLQAGLHGFVHRLAGDDARRLDFDALALGIFDRALAIDRVAEAVDDAAQQTLADGNVDDGAGTLDGVAFLDLGIRAEDHDADIVGFEVECHALNAIGELDHFARLDVVEAMDAGDAVTHGQNGTDFADLRFGAEIGDLVLDDLRNFCGVDIHVQPFIARARLFKRVRMEESIIWLPILTTSPPRIAGSTLASTATSRPTRALRPLASAVS